jgi:hypothetical protein
LLTWTLTLHSAIRCYMMWWANSNTLHRIEKYHWWGGGCQCSRLSLFLCTVYCIPLPPPLACHQHRLWLPTFTSTEWLGWRGNCNSLRDFFLWQNEEHEEEDPVVRMLDTQLTCSYILCIYIYTIHTPNKGACGSHRCGDGKLYSCRLIQLTWGGSLTYLQLKPCDVHVTAYPVVGPNNILITGWKVSNDVRSQSWVESRTLCVLLETILSIYIYMECLHYYIYEMSSSP